MNNKARYVAFPGVLDAGSHGDMPSGHGWRPIRRVRGWSSTFSAAEPCTRASVVHLS